MLSGHFLLSSGLHSDTYVQKARVLERPDVTMALAREIASWYERVDVVLAPAVGAIALGFAVALETGARSLFAEREDGRMALRRGFAIEPGERTLVVEDVVTTGGSAGEVWTLAGDLGRRATRRRRADRPDDVAAARSRSARCCASTRGRGTPDDCPLCRDGVPFDAPGSRHLRTP